MAETPDGERTELLVEGEVVEVHLAAGLHRQTLRVLDLAVGVDADESGNLKIYVLMIKGFHNTHVRENPICF